MVMFGRQKAKQMICVICLSVSLMFSAANETFALEHLPNDPMYKRQAHLQAIKAPEGWKMVSKNSGITIAVVDTGVDLNHPDLVNQLVPGYNVLNPGKLPWDDHGHGTRIAGIIGATGNNRKGVTGILWSSRIMPIKAIASNGQGEDKDVAEGIRYAVDHGADIIVLSLGDPLYAQHMKDAVEYAERKGVVVIAATGNDSGRINYPAALPTVLAVGAVDSALKPLSYENVGPEMDVVAIGDSVLTTDKGGKYGYVDGTSAAAAQAAGLAGLIKTKYPALSPRVIRDMIKYTSTDLGEKGWDAKTGYGLINLERALKTNPYSIPDYFEPNNEMAKAAAFPIGQHITSRLTNGADADWYKIQVPYAGRIDFDVRFNGNLAAPVTIEFYAANYTKLSSFRLNDDDTISVNVKPGMIYVKVSANGVYSGSYSLDSEFHIAKDIYESNDSKDRSYYINANYKVLTGNFHRRYDVDWYKIFVPEKGRIRIDVTTDTNRMDPVLTFGDETIDRGNIYTGQKESLDKEIGPGIYYFSLKNYAGYPVNGQYRLEYAYTPEAADFNEPNDTLDQAKLLSFNKNYSGTFGKTNDNDWFKFTLSGEAVLTFSINLPREADRIYISIYDGKRNLLKMQQITAQGTPQFFHSGLFNRGTYYINIIGKKQVKYKEYKFRAAKVDSYAGFVDIKDHWAKEDIKYLVEKGVIKRSNNYLYGPRMGVSRGQFIEMVVKSLEKKNGQKKLFGPYFAPFDDVPAYHSSSEAVRKAYSWGLIKYNHRFYPDRLITRGEAAAILARLSHDKVNRFVWLRSGFKDLPRTHWAYKEITFLKHEGLIKGYPNGRFYPDRLLSRSEMASWLRRIIFGV